MTSRKALGLLAAAVAMIGVYMALSSVLGITEMHGGFVFLLAWTLLERGGLKTLPRTAVGSAAGLTLGYALHRLAAYGAGGGGLFGLVVLVVIYFQLMGWLQLVINSTTMLFLLVVTIPHVQAHADFLHMAAGLVLGIVYFGIILGTVERIGLRRAATLDVSAARHER